MVPGRPRRRSLIQAAGASALASLLPARPAEARTLAQDEIRRLDAGEIVRIPLDLELARGDYFGGIAYAVMPATADQVMNVLMDPSSYRHIISHTRESRVIGERGLDRRIFFRTGGRRATVAYVLLVRRESPGLVRFWLDPSEPHDIPDCWGYFRVQPWPNRRSLLTYAALLRLDFGIIKLLFTETIRRVALNTPALLRGYVQEHRPT